MFIAPSFPLICVFSDLKPMFPNVKVEVSPTVFDRNNKNRSIKEVLEWPQYFLDKM